MNWATWIWIAWGGIFAVTEGIALRNKKTGDTLSEHVWKWFKVKEQPKRFTAGRFALLAGLVWLTGHLAFGWWAG